MFVLMPRHLANLRRNRGQSFDDPAPEPAPPPKPEPPCTCTTPDEPCCERCNSLCMWEDTPLEEFDF